VRPGDGQGLAKAEALQAQKHAKPQREQGARGGKEKEAHRESLAIVAHHGLEFGDRNRPCALVVEGAERFQDVILRLCRARCVSSPWARARGARPRRLCMKQPKQRCHRCCPGRVQRASGAANRRTRLLHGLEHAVDEGVKLHRSLLLRVHLLEQLAELVLRRVLSERAQQLAELPCGNRALAWRQVRLCVAGKCLPAARRTRHEVTTRQPAWPVTRRGHAVDARARAGVGTPASSAAHTSAVAPPDGRPGHVRHAAGARTATARAFADRRVPPWLTRSFAPVPDPPLQPGLPTQRRFTFTLKYSTKKQKEWTFFEKKLHGPGSWAAMADCERHAGAPGERGGAAC